MADTRTERLRGTTTCTSYPLASKWNKRRPRLVALLKRTAKKKKVATASDWRNTVNLEALAAVFYTRLWSYALFRFPSRRKRRNPRKGKMCTPSMRETRVRRVLRMRRRREEESKTRRNSLQRLRSHPRLVSENFSTPLYSNIALHTIHKLHRNYWESNSVSVCLVC